MQFTPEMMQGLKKKSDNGINQDEVRNTIFNSDAYKMQAPQNQTSLQDVYNQNNPPQFSPDMMSGLQKKQVSLQPEINESVKNFVKRTKPKAEDLFTGVDAANPFSYLPDVGNALQSGWNSLSGGVKDFGQGFANIVMSLPDATEGVLNQAYGAVTGDQSRVQRGMGLMDTAANKLYQGGTNAVAGGLQAIFSPVSAILSGTPSIVRKPIENSIQQDVGRIIGAAQAAGVPVNDPYLQGTIKNLGSLMQVVGIKDNPQAFKDYMNNTWNRPIEAGKEAIQGAKQFAGAMKEGIGSLQKQASAYFSSPKDLVNDLKSGSTDVKQVADKLSLQTGEVRSLQKYAGDKGMIKQINIAEQNLGKRTVGAPTPLRVPADEVLKAAKYLEKDNQMLSGQKAGLLKKYGTEKINLNTAATDFTNNLKEFGVEVKNGKFVYQDTSPFLRSPEVQELFEDTYQMIKKGKGVRTVADVEKISKTLFDRLDDIDAGALKVTRSKANAATVLTKLKQSLADELATKIPEYKTYNLNIAKNLSSLDKLYKKLGVKDIYTTLQDKSLKMEEFSRGVMSNTAADRLDVVNSVIDRAASRGLTVNKPALFKKIELADILEDITGTTKTKGFAGEIAKAGTKVLDKGVKAGILDTVVSKIARLPEAQDKLSALKQLLTQ